MDKATFLATMRRERAAWDSLLARIPDDRMTVPGVAGHWSVKDLIAHVAWYEQAAAEMIRLRGLPDRPIWQLPVDERNALIYAENRDRSLDDVRADAGRAFNDLVAAVAALDDADLLEPGRLGLPGDWIPWQAIASDCYQHYHQHLPDVQRWLAAIQHGSV